MEHLPESSATRRQHSPFLVDNHSVLLAALFDLQHRKAAGKKGVPKEKLMMTRISKQAPQASLEDQREAAQRGRVLYQKRMKVLRAKQEAESTENSPIEDA